MKYQDAKELLPNANYIYAGVTDDEVAQITSAHYDTRFDDVRLLGTIEPIESLANKELLAGSVSFN